MEHGFIKMATAVPECRVGDCAYNGNKIIELLHEADRQQVEIAVFPELCITGYTCGDLFGQQLLLDAADQTLRPTLLPCILAERHPSVQRFQKAIKIITADSSQCPCESDGIPSRLGKRTSLEVRRDFKE